MSRIEYDSLFLEEGSKSYLVNLFTKERIPIAEFYRENVISILDDKTILMNDNNLFLVKDLYSGEVLQTIKWTQYKKWDNYIFIDRNDIYKYDKNIRIFVKVDIPNELNINKLKTIYKDELIFEFKDHIIIYDLINETSKRIELSDYKLTVDKHTNVPYLENTNNYTRIKFLNSDKVIHLPLSSENFILDGSALSIADYEGFLIKNNVKYTIFIKNDDAKYTIFIKNNKVLLSEVEKSNKNSSISTIYPIMNMILIDGAHDFYMLDLSFKKQIKVPRKISRSNDSEINIAPEEKGEFILINENFVDLNTGKSFKMKDPFKYILFPFVSDRQVEYMIENIETNMISKDIKRIIAKFI